MSVSAVDNSLLLRLLSLFTRQSNKQHMYRVFEVDHSLNVLVKRGILDVRPQVVKYVFGYVEVNETTRIDFQNS